MRILVSTLLLLAMSAHAQTPDPTLPPANQHAVLTVQGRGAQVYRCQASGNSSFQWVFRAPVARLFDAAGQEVGTHGDGPIWIALDSSSIQGTAVASLPSPGPTSVPWLLLKAHSPQRTGILTAVECIRRSDTKGGATPAAGCDATHEGELVRVPYTATYTFYSSRSPTPAN